MGRDPTMVELVIRTRTKKLGDFVDERTKKALVSYFILFKLFIFFYLIATLWRDFHVATEILWRENHVVIFNLLFNLI